MKQLSLYFVLCIFQSCLQEDHPAYTGKAEQQILAAEADFEKAVREKGVKEAFLEFADDSAVISRSGKIYVTKKGIENYFNSQSIKTTSLEWSPDFVKASISGDMGYTYGKYKFSAEDSTGGKIDIEGIFHTVWKKQEDGSWKFVYD